MTLAELKRRLVVGTKITLVERNTGRMLAKPVLREVVAVKSRTFVLRDESGDWDLPFPKASCIRETPDGFAIVDGQGRVMLRYVWFSPNAQNRGPAA